MGHQVCRCILKELLQRQRRVFVGKLPRPFQKNVRRFNDEDKPVYRGQVIEGHFVLRTHRVNLWSNFSLFGQLFISSSIRIMSCSMARMSASISSRGRGGGYLEKYL